MKIYFFYENIFSMKIGVRGFLAREYVSAPVRVGWKGTRFCRRVLLSSFFFLLSFFSHPESCLKIKILVGETTFWGGAGGPGGLSPGESQGGTQGDWGWGPPGLSPCPSFPLTPIRSCGGYGIYFGIFWYIFWDMLV